MKKYITLLTAVLFSGTAMAETGLTVGLGFQTSQVANNFDLNGDPAGLSFNVHYAIPGVDGLFVGLDFTDQEDEADMGPPDTMTTTQERTAFEIGYVFTLDDSTSLSAAISNADIQWEWEDGIPTNFTRVEGDDSGVSVVIAADKNLGNGVTMGTALSLGFETGVEAYTSFEVVENFDIKMSYYKRSYELEFDMIDEAGPVGFGSAYGDDDLQYDTSGFRVSANYSF